MNSLADINRKYLKHYPNIYIKYKPSCVKFSDDIEIIIEPENLAEDLQLARISDYAQRQVVKARMERLLSPLMSTTHRWNIYKNLQGEIKKEM